MTGRQLNHRKLYLLTRLTAIKPLSDTNSACHSLIDNNTTQTADQITVDIQLCTKKMSYSWHYFYYLSTSSNRK
jgi:hypothetical protein